MSDDQKTQAPESVLGIQVKVEGPETAVQATGEVATSNARHDAPTIYIDALQGMMISPDGVKVSFLEHFVEGQSVNGRYVLNLMMTFQQMKAIGELFTETARQAEIQFKKLDDAGA